MKENSLQQWQKLMERGTQYLSKEYYHEAEKCFINGVDIARELLVPEILAFTLRLLATVRVKLGSLNLAERGFKDALKICQEIDNAKGMSEAWAGLASVCVARDQLEEAKNYYESSIEIYPSTSPQLRLGMLYTDIAHVYTTLGKWEKAIQSYRSARDLCRLNNYPKGEGEINVLLGEIYYRLNKKAEAKTLLMKACQQFAKIQDFDSLANSSQYLAFLYYDLEQFSYAFECQQRAVIIILREDKSDEISEALYFLSKIEQCLGAEKEAEKHLELSLNFHKEEDQGLALRYQSMAGLAMLRFDLPKAEKYYLLSLEIFENLQDDFKIKEISEALAYVIEAQGRQNEALKYHRKSEGNSEADQYSTLTAVRKLGEFFEKRNKYLDALSYYWEAMKKAKGLGEDIIEIEKSIQRVSRKIRQRRK